ncbi:hypothetical protein [Terracidiphilus sp.]|jgi:hypothetical protein|uniref:hypothetical protein n=1 Tax=Terracidiphilus sp. TaxID=1964191 RepID=UPI003C131738
MSAPHNRPCIHQETRNTAVHRCCQARNRALADCKNLKLLDFQAAALGAEAYLAALPELASTQDIRDYAACINHGIAIRVIPPFEGNAMLGTGRLVLDTIRTEFKANESALRTGIAQTRLDRANPRKQPQSAA